MNLYVFFSWFTNKSKGYHVVIVDVYKANLSDVNQKLTAYMFYDEYAAIWTLMYVLQRIDTKKAL